MKIFGSLDQQLFPVSNIGNSKRGFVYGAWAGIGFFYQALLKHSTFDEYHFFIDSAESGNLIKKSLSQLGIDLSKIKIIKPRELAFYLQKIEYTVFFTVGTNLSTLAGLRLKYAKQYFPVCGMAFQTMSYPSYLKADFFDNMTSDLHPFDSIICCSSAVYKAIQNLNNLVSRSFKREKKINIRYNGRLDLLPFGIEADDYGKLNQLEARKKLGLPKDKIILLCFGRFSLYDKADLYPLLVAFKEVLRVRKDILLLLAGVDSQHGYGAKLKVIANKMGLAPHVKFILHNCLKDKFALYSASDIFVSPSDSIQESFGITVLEAMASGLPAVVSDWDGYKDLVVHNETGFRAPTYWADCKIEERSFFNSLFNPWELDHLYLAQSVCVDVKKITEYLSILIKNKDLRLKFGQNAKKIVLERYDWNVLMPAYEKCWQKLSRLSKNHKVGSNKRELFMPKYLPSFFHYPTRILDKKTKIHISKNGLLFLQTKRLPFNIQKELLDIISIKVIFIMLTFLFGRDAVTFGEIESYTKKVFKIVSSADIKFHIMWLLKKDLIRLL